MTKPSLEAAGVSDVLVRAEFCALVGEKLVRLAEARLFWGKGALTPRGVPSLAEGESASAGLSSGVEGLTPRGVAIRAEGGPAIGLMCIAS